jgi:hypothetical protein
MGFDLIGLGRVSNHLVLGYFEFRIVLGRVESVINHLVSGYFGFWIVSGWVGSIIESFWVSNHIRLNRLSGQTNIT